MKTPIDKLKPELDALDLSDWKPAKQEPFVPPPSPCPHCEERAARQAAYSAIYKSGRWRDDSALSIHGDMCDPCWNHVINIRRVLSRLP